MSIMRTMSWSRRAASAKRLVARGASFPLEAELNSTIPMISYCFRSTRGATQMRRAGGLLAQAERTSSDKTAIERTGIRGMAHLLRGHNLGPGYARVKLILNFSGGPSP